MKIGLPKRVSYEWKMMRLRKAGADLDSYYARILDEARHKKAPRDKIDAFAEEWYVDGRLHDEEMAFVQSVEIRRRCRALLIPTPEFDMKSPSWTQDDFSGKWHLTVETMHDLREKIRAEELASLDIFFKIVAACTGLGGVLVGILALAWKH